jgi:hypothetical protein
MARKRKLIPFSWLPAAWGLAGDPLRLAEANYYYDGADLERELVKITAKDEKEQKIKLLAIDRKEGLITDPYEYEIQLAIANHGTLDDVPAMLIANIQNEHGKIEPEAFARLQVKDEFPDEKSVAHKIAMLDVDLEFGHLTEQKFEKECATLKNEPWVGVVDNGFDQKQGINGLYFELDWNEQWVSFLRQNGYMGHDDEQVVEQWFSDVCRSQAEMTPVEQDNTPFNSARITRIHRNDDDGSSEFS